MEIQKVSIVPGHEIVPDYQSTLYKVETDKGVYVAAHGIPEHQKNETHEFVDWSKLIGKTISANLRHYDDESRWIGLSQKFDDKTPENSNHALLSNWYLEETRFSCYLVFDGSKDKFGEVLELLKKNKVLPKTSGQSYRPAKNGYQYDWYIRLPHEDYEDAEKDINNFLGLGESSNVLIKDWYIETNFYGHYVLIDGSDEYLNEVVNRLEVHGLKIRRRDRSYRAADNGHMYDWFIRLDFEGTREEVLEKVKSALEGDTSDEEFITQEDQTVVSLHKELEELSFQTNPEIAERLLKRIEQLKEQISKRKKLTEQTTSSSEVPLESELESSRNEVADYKRLLKRAEVEAKNESTLLKAKISELEVEIDALQTNKLNNITSGQESTKLRTEIATLKNNFKEQEKTLLTLATDFEQEAIQYKKDFDNLRKEYEELEKENVSLRGKTNKHNQTNKIINRIEQFFSHFKNITIHPETSQIVFEKFPNAVSLFEVFNRLDKGERVPATKINGSKLGWFKVLQHIKTGNDNLGRIYYVREDGQEKLTVMAYHKKNDIAQQRFHKTIDNPKFLTSMSFERPVSASKN